jgi:hypothetical protein
MEFSSVLVISVGRRPVLVLLAVLTAMHVASENQNTQICCGRVRLLFRTIRFNLCISVSLFSM